MSQTDLVRAIIDCEAEYPVHRWTVNGIHVWPLVRMNMYINALEPSSGAKFPQKRTRRHMLLRGARESLHEMASAIRMETADSRMNAKPGAACDFVLFSSAVHRVSVEGKYCHDIYSPLSRAAAQMNRKASLWEMANYRSYSYPRDLPSAAITPRVRYLQGVSAVRSIRTVAAELDEYEDFVAHARSKGLRSMYFDTAILKREATFVRAAADQYKRWLRKSGARIGLVNGNDKLSGAFTLACRELGILSIELQHGVQTDLHLAYGSWTKLPPGGFSLRPHLFWCWDTLSAEPILRWARTVPGAHDVIVGGNPALVAPWRVSNHTRVQNEISRLLAQHPRRQLLLVTLSSDGPLIPPECLQALELLRNEFVVGFRLHPVNKAQRARELNALLASGIGLETIPFESCTDFPLDAWLRFAACLLDARWSTVIHEAAIAGVRSVASCPESADFFPEHFNSGYLRVHREPSEIAQAVREQSRFRAQSSAETAPPLTETLRSLFEISESLRTGKTDHAPIRACYTKMAGSEE